MDQVKKKYAFISYSHKDEKTAIWLQRKLESYRLPTQINNEFDGSKYLRPVFRDETDLDTGILSEELCKHLDSSKFLIVICSVNAATSKWVSSEVEHFIMTGRLEYVIPFVIEEGGPDNPMCYPRYLNEYLRRHPKQELLSISTRALGREKSFVKTVSRMLGLSFDELWRRHERERRRKTVFFSVCLVVMTAIFYLFAIPMDVSIYMRDGEHELPIPETGTLQVGTQQYVLTTVDTIIRLDKLAGYKRLLPLSVCFEAVFYNRIDTMVSMGICGKNEIYLDLTRDETFSVYAGQVLDENGSPVDSALFKVKDNACITDKEGRFRVVLPLREQTECSEIEIFKTGYEPYERHDEVPGETLRYILRKKDN